MQTGINVQIARPIAKDEISEWHKKQGLTVDENGEFTAMPYGEGPVTRDSILEQVALNSLRRDVPNLRTREYTPKIMVYVGGGPTIKTLLDEIKHKCESPLYDVFASNKTVSYLLSQGIKPDFHLIVDPTEKKVKDLEYDDDTIPLVLGLQCHPALFEFAKKRGRKVEKFLAASITNDDGRTDRDAAKPACWDGDNQMMGIGGGSMCGTRMLYFASARGYRRIEFYGVDGSIEMKDNKIVNCYAYPKPRGENIIESTASNGKVFFTTITLARQAEELVQMMDILPGMDVEIYGESLMSNHLSIYKQLRKGLDIRITPEYKAMQSQMHDDRGNYGTSAVQHAARVFMAAAQLHRKFGECSILDYGCGKGTLGESMWKAFPQFKGLSLREYDPGIKGKDDEPVPATLLFCGDVLEHIEPECVDAVLQHISDLTDQLAILVISLRPAQKTLPDGRNAHICLQKENWWLSKLRRHFVISESHANEEELMAICIRFPK